MSDKTKAELVADAQALETKLSVLAARIAELEKAGEASAPFVRQPNAPWDPTANASMPREALREMLAAVPDRLMADLRSDALKPNPVTQGTSQLGGGGGGGAVERGTGWQDALRLTSPADTEHARMARSAREKG
jgi:hypothetical protein